MNQPQMNNRGPKFKLNLYWIYAVILGVLVMMCLKQDYVPDHQVTWTEFKQYGKQGLLSDVTVYSRQGEAQCHVKRSLEKKLFPKFTGNEANKPVITVVYPSNDMMQKTIDDWTDNGNFKGEVKYDTDSGWWSTIGTYLPLIFFILIWFWIIRGMGSRGAGGIFSVGKSKAKQYDKDNSVKVTFADVAGQEEAKTEVAEIVDFLKNPATYTALGGKIPKGALLVGPPGTGKTLLAKAVAGEADVPFFSISGSDFVEMFVGVGASRVRDLFAKAKEKAPCIVFIDEIDAVGRARGRNPNMSSNDERENTLNQLLTEMDGFGTNSGVIILAATNRADMLDKALLRAGRFDRQIYVELPDINGRKAIFGVHLRKVKTDESLDLDLLARQTPGFSGADIANVCNEAALIAARNKKSVVEHQDFMNAVDRIVGGLEKKNKITTAEERRAIATHEAGHATVSWHLQYANPLVKVTIVPRGKALGAAHYLPEERQITPKQALKDELCSLLGGRAAEELFLGEVSTGAANDLERATKLAYAMVVYYGLSDAIPNVSYYDSTGQAYGFSKPYSDERARVIDEEVSRIIKEQYERAKEVLKQYAFGHASLTDTLLSREVIYTEDVIQIFGERQWTSRTDELLKANEEAEKQTPEEASEGSDSETTNPEGKDSDKKADEETPTPPPFIRFLTANKKK